MASTMDSIKMILGDSHPLYKIAGFSLFPFLSYYFYTIQSGFFGLIFAVISLFMYLGMFSRILHQSINEELNLIPRPNPFGFWGIGFKTIFAVGPYALLNWFLANTILSFVTLEELSKNILTGFVYAIFLLLLFAPWILFARKYSIKGAYNIKALLKFFHEVVLGSIVFILIAGLLNILVFGMFGFFVHMLFGFNNIFSYYVSFVITTNLMFYASYLGLLHYELFQDFSE